MVASQKTITALVDNQIASMYIGHPRKTRTSATAPVLVRFRDGTRLNGTLLLRKYGSRWYVYSITAGAVARNVASVASPPGVPVSVVGTCVSQQAANQSFALGVLYGRFHQIDITSVSKNWGTASIRMRLSGGSSRKRNATMTCLSRVGTNGKTYWFLAKLK